MKMKENKWGRSTDERVKAAAECGQAAGQVMRYARSALPMPGWF